MLGLHAAMFAILTQAHAWSTGKVCIALEVMVHDKHRNQNAVNIHHAHRMPSMLDSPCVWA